MRLGQVVTQPWGPRQSFVERSLFPHGHRAPGRHTEQNPAFVESVVERSLIPHKHHRGMRSRTQLLMESIVGIAVLAQAPGTI